MQVRLPLRLGPFGMTHNQGSNLESLSENKELKFTPEIQEQDKKRYFQLLKPENI